MRSMITLMNMSIKTCSRSPIALAALVALGISGGALAVRAEGPAAPLEPPPTLRAPSSQLSTPELPPPDPQLAPAAGLRIFVDPLTGELTPWPTPQQAGELARALAGFRFEPRIEPGDRTQGLVRFELSRGGTGIRLDERYMTATVVHLGPDGEPYLGCTHDPEAALEAHTHPRSRPATGAPLK